MSNQSGKRPVKQKHLSAVDQAIKEINSLIAKFACRSASKSLKARYAQNALLIKFNNFKRPVELTDKREQIAATLKTEIAAINTVEMSLKDGKVTFSKPNDSILKPIADKLELGIKVILARYGFNGNLSKSHKATKVAFQMYQLNKIQYRVLSAIVENRKASSTQLTEGSLGKCLAAASCKIESRYEKLSAKLLALSKATMSKSVGQFHEFDVITSNRPSL